MKLDIVFVSYNSEKWLERNIQSILKTDYDLKNISLLYCDNNSTDNTVDIIKKIKQKYEKRFNKIEYIVSNKNKGFGYGNNLAAKLGDSPYIFIFNIDTEVNKDTFKLLEQKIKESDDSFGMWELAQRPYEHPKYFDPITGETSWASGACMVVKRDVFEKLGGFDENIFMYCEDVEISWNFRKHGYKIKYLYDVPITHYSYEKPNEFKYTQFVYGFISNWYIRAKYGAFKNFLRGTQYMFQTGFKGKSIPMNLDLKTKRKIKKEMRKAIYKYSLRNILVNLTRDRKVVGDFRPRFLFGLDYEISKENAFYVQPEIETNPLVSIIVRTCNRKEALRECLMSIRNQTYKNYEVVVIEDGKDTSGAMIKKEFSDMNIKYHATGVNQGRSHAANLGMEKAKGKYLNFLDDDDLFMPDHIETLVKVLEKNNWEIAYDGAYETQIEIINRKPYSYVVKAKGLFDSRTFDKKRLYKVNLFPIQTVMFRRELYKECGGIDENIDALEDWDFWVRLSLKHSFHQVKNTTSIFRTPYNKTIKKEREEFLASTLEYLRDKFKDYIPELSVYDIHKDGE